MLNKEYRYGRLLEVNPDPFTQFSDWFREACESMPTHLVNSMALATVSPDGQPSVRIVLLKEYSSRGFIFYTNYLSHKGADINRNPKLALLFWWEPLERQIRIEGRAEKISPALSEQYFHSRPKNSQIAALASQQSQPLPHIEHLQNHYQQLCAEYASAETMVPCPEHWGGYLVNPDRFEFWQGRESRLHDRFQYTACPDQTWQITRLFP